VFDAGVFVVEKIPGATLCSRPGEYAGAVLLFL